MNRIDTIGAVTLILFIGLIGTAVNAETMKKKSGMMHKEETIMEAMKTGMLAGAGSHRADGHVGITKDMKGRPMLTLSDIHVDKVPDGRVYLAKGGNYAKGVELGKLRQFKGTVSFPIPAGIDTNEYDSVVIWCKKFDVEIGHAFFDMKGMEKDMMKKMEPMMK